MTNTSKENVNKEECIKNSIVSSKRIDNSWILLAKESLLNNNEFHIVTMTHPATGDPARYCLDKVNKKIYEIITFDEPHRSWFIGETVKSNGIINMMTPINVTFLVLPKLREQCVDRAVPLEDLLSGKGFYNIIDYVSDLDHVADLKGPAEIKAYKFNIEKAMTWLENKVHKLSKVLRQKNIHVTSGAASSTFISSNIKNEAIDEEFYLKYAHGVISEYLQDELVVKLEKRLNFTPDLIESVGKKRKSEVESNNESKKTKHDVLNNAQTEIKVTPIIDAKKPKSLSAKDKARQKAASGTKTISSFFTKK